MVERRTVLKGLVAGALVWPRLALAQAPPDPTHLVNIKTAGGQAVAGALVSPASTPAPAVLLVHEWWGLNDTIKRMAAELAGQGYLALAVDLFHGRVVTSPDEARALVAATRPDEAADTLTSWAAWLRNHPDGNRRLGTVGWCFGGGWALRASTLTPMDATVVYYGKCDWPADQLARLSGPVLGHFGTRDTAVPPAMVATFEATMKRVGKPYTIFWYEAGHAFANPTGTNYAVGDARLAWDRTLAFFKLRLR